MTEVIKIDAHGLSRGKRLVSSSAVPPEEVLSGHPEEQSCKHVISERYSIGTWQSTPYSENLLLTDRAEFGVVLSGKLAITGHDGKVETFGPGDSYFLPMGLMVRFEVLETLRKISVSLA